MKGVKWGRDLGAPAQFWQLFPFWSEGGTQPDKDLLAAGVPLNCARRRRETGTPRWHIQYGNQQVASAQRLAGRRFTRAERREVRQAACSTWRVMSFQEQAAFQATMVRKCTDDDDHADVEDNVNLASERRTPWVSRIGSLDWPFNPELICPILSQHTRATDIDLHGGHGCGVCARFRSIEKSVRESGVVMEANAIDADEQITIKAACFQAHPGLCAQRDADIYDEALELAGALEKHFPKEAKGSQCQIRFGDWVQGPYSVIWDLCPEFLFDFMFWGPGPRPLEIRAILVMGSARPPGTPTPYGIWHIRQLLCAPWLEQRWEDVLRPGCLFLASPPKGNEATNYPFVLKS